MSVANKVNISPSVPSPFNLGSFGNVSDFLTNLVQMLRNELQDHALRLNASMQVDGTEVPTAPVRLKTYVKAALPSASAFPNSMIIVSNDTGGLTPAFSDGVNWRRTADRNIIS